MLTNIYILKFYFGKTGKKIGLRCQDTMNNIYICLDICTKSWKEEKKKLDSKRKKD